MSRSALTLSVLLLSFTGMAVAQHAVDPAQRYYRLICLVHLTGSGKSDDPGRNMGDTRRRTSWCTC
ncbi:MAG TPA: hypothetical protein VHY84_18085 [Bryobacteraceae bacterium]|nr:hypothetical protein [Bryobacteraceae bacterium]